MGNLVGLGSIIMRLEYIDRIMEDKTIPDRENKAAELEKVADNLYRLAHSLRRQ